MKKILATFLVSLIFGTLIMAQEDTVVYERRPFQMTFFFPPLSTNGANNAHIVNDVSLNLFLGVSGGEESLQYILIWKTLRTSQPLDVWRRTGW